MNEEMILKAAEIENRARQLEESLQLIDNQILELDNFIASLNNFSKTKENEMLSSLGRRVYVKTRIEDKERLFVEVGAGVVVRKSINDTSKIAKDQISRLQDARMQILSKLSEYHAQLQEFMDAIQR